MFQYRCSKPWDAGFLSLPSALADGLDIIEEKGFSQISAGLAKAVEKIDLHIRQLKQTAMKKEFNFL